MTLEQIAQGLLTALANARPEDHKQVIWCALEKAYEDGFYDGSYGPD